MRKSDISRALVRSATRLVRTPSGVTVYQPDRATMETLWLDKHEISMATLVLGIELEGMVERISRSMWWTDKETR